MSIYVTNSSGTATKVANLQGTGYQKPSNGIPLTDLTPDVQNAILTGAGLTSEYAWPTGTEQNLGNGRYGLRISLTITPSANTELNQNLAVLPTMITRFVSVKGTWTRPNSAYSIPYAQGTAQYASVSASNISGQGNIVLTLLQPDSANGEVELVLIYER